MKRSKYVAIGTETGDTVLDRDVFVFLISLGKGMGSRLLYNVEREVNSSVFS